jgi:hypothetical protein
MEQSEQRKRKKRAMMLGLGLDSDGHKRITKGENFTLIGGSKITHEAMTETVIKINEKLSKKGKTLDTVEHEEFNDIAQEVGLHPIKLKIPPNN